MTDFAPATNLAANKALVIDTTAPANVTSALGTAGVSEVSLSWTNPVDADFGTVIILRHTSAITDTPVQGATYIAGNSIGSATVACVTSSTSCTDTGLTND